MSDDEPMPGRRPAQWVCGIVSVLFFWGLVVWLAPQLRPLRVPTVYALLPVAFALFAFASAFAHAGRDTLPAVPLVAGLALFIGGSVADIYATLAHTPDLKREANPVIRELLDTGHPIEFVYAYGLTGQALWILAGVALWVGLLRHRTDLVRHMPATGSLLAYLKAGTGGRDLTYRQWLCPLRWNELPRPVPFVCGTAIVWVGISLLRYYAAAEWYQLVRPTFWNRVTVFFAILVVVCVAYARWLRTARRALPEPEPLALALKTEILDLPPDGNDQ